MTGAGVLVLISPSTLAAQGSAVGPALAELGAAGPVELVATSDAGRLAEVVDSCQGRRLVVIGGDGSVHRLVQVLHEQDRLDQVVALVPMGTGNDLARGQGIPLDPAQAARLAVTGAPRPRDLALDEDGRVVVNVVHAGPSARSVERAAAVKSALGRAAYAVGAFAQGVTVTGAHLRVRVDGEVVHDGVHRVLMVVVALGSTIGGGARVAPDAERLTGQADVTVSLATGPVARVAYAWSMRKGRHRQRDDVLLTSGREVVVEGAGGTQFLIDADGEPYGPFPSRTWRVPEATWQLVSPAAPAARGDGQAPATPSAAASRSGKRSRSAG